MEINGSVKNEWTEKAIRNVFHQVSSGDHDQGRGHLTSIRDDTECENRPLCKYWEDGRLECVLMTASPEWKEPLLVAR